MCNGGIALIYKGSERRIKTRADIVPKILVCDDDEQLCEVISLWLNKVKCRHVIVHSRQDCLEKVKKEFFKVVLLDNVFPDGKGVNIIADIRDVSPATKIVIMTGYGISEDKLMALNYGAGYIEKPLNLKSLAAKLKLVLSG